MTLDECIFNISCKMQGKGPVCFSKHEASCIMNLLEELKQLKDASYSNKPEGFIDDRYYAGCQAMY